MQRRQLGDIQKCAGAGGIIASFAGIEFVV